MAAMQRLVDIEINQEFQLHTSYHNDFFLLRTKVLVDGKSTEIRTVQEGSYVGPVLMVSHSGSTSCKLWLIANAVSPILHRFGVYHVDTFYYEQSPLFHTVFSSESCLRKFLLAVGEVQSALETQLHSLLSRNVKSTQCHTREADSPQLAIEVQPELFLVSPNQLNTKGADLHVVTADNCSTLLTHWKSSKLFEFASLYQEEAQSPNIALHPASQNNVLPGGSLTLFIRVTGAEPLSYQWQWKPAGKEDEQHEWQDLSCDGTTFQEVEGGLKITGVQACHAGDYRCVVSNSAGSEISQCANLTVEKAPQITTQPMNQKDAHQGSPLSFKIKATGAEPLSYQWQWKPAGKENEQHEWQDLPRDGTTFQEVEGGLKITGVQACHAGKYQCVVSNSAGSEISWCATLTVVPELLDLVRGLRGVNNWKTLGLYLGIKIEKLNVIEMDHPTIEDRRTKMLEEWQNDVIPTWSAVVQALVGMGMRRLASNLAQKHGIPTPEEPDDEPVLEQLKNLPQQNEENAAKLCEGIQKLRDDLKQDRKRLVDSEAHLRQLQESKQAANENAKDCLTELEKLQEDVQKIVQEKSNIEMELRYKERECQLLSEIKEDKAYNQFLQNKIAKKRKKINKLKQELEMKECKLRSAQQEAETWQEELSQAHAEVRKKHKEVKELQRENEKLASSYYIKKEEISNLVQIALTSVKEEMKQQIVSMKDESELNLQHMEASYNANIRHLSEDIEALTSSLHKKEEHLQVASTPEQPLGSLTELERRLQDTEYQKQHAESEREAAVREVKARKEFEVRLHAQLDEPPNITSHPDSLKEVRPGKAVAFTVQATGTQPLTYEWQWKPAEKGDENEEWQSRDVEGPTLTIPRVQKSDEGQYCCVIYNHAGRQISKPAHLETRLQNELRTPLKLRWKKQSNMLYGMTDYPKTVQLHNNLYVGGGDCYSDSISKQCTVLKYDQSNDTWSKLPQYDCRLFSMSAINGYLTVVGGRDIATGRLSRKVGVWEPSSQQWTQPYPPMITPRYWPEVATYNNYLLAVGGKGDGGSPLTTVEVLDVRDGRQWLTVTQLPVPCAYKTSAIIQDNCYVITSSKEVISAYLPALCQTASKSAAIESPARWQRLADTPLRATTAIALSGSLLTVGGLHDNTTSTAIHLYHPETNTWTEVGNLPTPRYYCSATVLASGELLVSGGQDQTYKLTTLVDIATILLD